MALRKVGHRRRGGLHVVVDEMQEPVEPLHGEVGGRTERAQAEHVVLRGALDQLVHELAEHRLLEERAQVEMAAPLDDLQHLAQAVQAPRPLVVAVGLLGRAGEVAERQQNGIAARLQLAGRHRKEELAPAEAGAGERLAGEHEQQARDRSRLCAKRR